MQPNLYLKRLTFLTMCTFLPRIFPQEMRGFFTVKNTSQTLEPLLAGVLYFQTLFFLKMQVHRNELSLVS
ncbi:hypothetical protein ABIA48_000740 [Pseudomonas sp. S30_BP2TU TE3576]|jgi:hypothetical protein